MKASEIFDLPLEADDSCLYQSCGSDKYVARFDTQEQAKIAANSINHADALADALERICNDACDNGMHNRTSVYLATEALAAYRGVK